MKRDEVPSREEIREHISGNYCRCTGYHAIVDAVESVARKVESTRRGEAMKITADTPPVLTALDRPNSYIGRSVPRPNLQRLTQGRGQYVSDVTLPRMAHVAFLRSPHAHARIVSISTDAAKKVARRHRRRHRRGTGQGDDALGRRAHPSQGHQVGAAIADRGRPRLLAGRSRVRRGRAYARAGRGRLRTDRHRL